MKTPEIDKYLDEFGGKALIRLWKIIGDLQARSISQNDGDRIKWSLQRENILDALARSEGERITNNNFKQRMNRLRKALNDALKQASNPDSLVSITLSEKQDNVLIHFEFDISGELQKITKAKTIGDDQGIIEVDVKTSPTLGELMNNPICVLISHAHSKSEKIEAIKNDFYQYCQGAFENLPAGNSDIKFKLIYDKEALEATQSFNDFTYTSAANSLFAIFLTSNEWRDSYPCKKELSYFYNKNQRKQVSHRRCIFIAMDNQFCELGEDFEDRVNWVQWFGKKSNQDYQTLIDFWECANEPDKLAFIDSIRDSFIKELCELKNSSSTSRRYSKHLSDYEAVEVVDKFAPKITEDYLLSDARLSSENVNRFPVQSALMKWAGLPDDRCDDCPNFSTRFMVLLGDFGSGKTTGLKYFCRQLMDRRKNDPNVPLPIYLGLREMVSEVDRNNPNKPFSLERLIAKGLAINDESQEMIERWLTYIRNHSCIIVMDGLDEVGNSIGVNAANHLLEELLNILSPEVWVRDGKHNKPDWEYCPTRLILSCRTHFFRDQEEETASLSAHYRNETFSERKKQFSRLYLAPFTLKQIQEWLNRNLGKEEGFIAFEKMQKLHDLVGLAERPILLRLITESLDDIALEHQAGKPLNNALIYDKIFRRTIKRDDSSKSLQIQIWEKINILRMFAKQLWLEKERTLPADALDQWFARDGVQQLDQGIDWTTKRDSFLTELHNSNLLVRHGNHNFGFAHTSFFEFFLAQFLWHVLVGDIELDKEIELPVISEETQIFFYEYAELASQQQQKKAGARIANYFKGKQHNHQFWFDLLFQDFTPARKLLLGGIEPDGLDFSGVNLTHWKAEGLSMMNINLTDNSLTAANWNNVKLINCQLEGCLMGSGHYRHCHFTNCEGRPRYLASSLFQSCHFYPNESDVWQKIRFANRECYGLPSPPTLINQSVKLTYALGHTNFFSTASFSPDGRKIVTASYDGTARIWDSHNGQELMVLNGHEDHVFSASFSSDGKRIVTASYDETARIWDSHNGQELMILNGHRRFVTSASFSSDGKRIVTASYDETARIWDSHNGQELMILNGHRRFVTSASFSPDGKKIITGSNDNTARIWDSHNGQELIILNRHEGLVREGLVCSAAFSPDGKQIVTGSSDKTARIWDSHNGQELMVLNGHEDHVFSASFSSDGKRIVTASYDETARIWDSHNGQELMILNGHRRFVTSASFSSDGKRIVTASYDETARIWDSHNGQELMILNGHRRFVTSASFSPDGKKIITGSNDNTVRIWDSHNGQELIILNRHEGLVREGLVRSAAFSPDGKQIVTGSSDKTARIWDSHNGQELMVLNGHEDDVLSASFSSDGKQIVTASYDGTARIWDSHNGQELMVLKGYKSSIHSASFFQDGKQIVTASRDKTTRIWDVETGKEIKKFSTEEAEEKIEAWLSKAQQTKDLELVLDRGGVLVKSKDTGEIIRQLYHLPEGWAVADGKGFVTNASPEAWPYLRCKITNDDGSIEIYPADRHPDWDKICNLA